MASTNKTPKLGLNQWAAGDPVLREDFNGDNQKIEATVETLRNENCMVKLIDITTTAASAQYDLDVSGIVWSKYVEVIIYANIRCTGVGTNASGGLRINGYAGNADYLYVANSSFDQDRCNECALQPANGSARNRYTIFSMDEGYTICSDASYTGYCSRNSGYCYKVPKLADIHTLNFVSQQTGVTMVPGSHIVVYGIRK